LQEQDTVATPHNLLSVAGFRTGSPCIRPQATGAERCLLDLWGWQGDSRVL